ncbi:MAG: dipeptide epimerase [Bacteroidetes bacterium]|nr:dipeptide epimerase [Bacteroidota bacterium]
MKIKDIRISRIPLDLTRPYSIAYKTVTNVEICFAEVEIDGGLTGFGASNPSKAVVGESMDDCIAALNPTNLDRFIGRDIRELRLLCEELHEVFLVNPGAKAALDIAFHDLFGQYLKVPVATFLGQRIKSLPTSITIGIKGVDETAEEAQEYIDRGFKILKVKLGKSLDEDLERLRKLRTDFSPQIGIRVDANQGYSVAELERFHRETQSLNLELVEQPLPAKAVAEMKALPKEIRDTIAADEALVNVENAFELVSGVRASGIFNIKLMKCGGIHQALRIAEVARLAHCDLMWGCNDESIVSIAAGLHVAFSCPHTKYIDLDGSLDLATDVVSGGFVIREGVMYLTDKAGLGVTKI